MAARSKTVETVKVECPSGGWMLVNKSEAGDHKLYRESKVKVPPADNEGDSSETKGKPTSTAKK